jgi:DNA-binding transcriptional ArsR family regulator
MPAGQCNQPGNETDLPYGSMSSLVEFLLDADDLAETVFAFSALNETALSLRAWRFPEVHPEHVSGLRRLRPEFDALDNELLAALVTDRRMLPDFLTPRPSTALPDPAAEFAALRHTPPSVVCDHVVRAYAGSPLPSALADARSDPASLLGRIADALESYWQRCLAPRWPRMRALLEADVAYRGRTLALGGAQALFADLDERVSWRNGSLRLRLPGATDLSQVVPVGGRGLVLAPCLFVRGAVTMIDASGPPLLVYPARARAALWEASATITAPALDELIGRTRSRLLTMLDQPISTTELARLLDVTPGAVSRHLTALYDARLLNRSRSGRSVLYFRSPLGDALLA